LLLKTFLFNSSTEYLDKLLYRETWNASGDF
jgi:hypothetical protein